MRHQVAGRKLGRKSEHRWALLRNLVTSLLENERIRTTDSKAKELRPIAEKMIELGKRGDLHARRQALAVVRKPEVVHKLFETLSPRYRSRSGGYTRIVKVGHRPGDGALVSIIELITEGKEVRPSRRRRKGKEKTPEAAKPTEPASPA